MYFHVHINLTQTGSFDIDFEKIPLHKFILGLIIKTHTQ